MNRAYLLMGGNLGDRVLNLKKATTQIEKCAGKIIEESKTYQTEAWGITDQPAFLNKVLFINTKLNADELLSALLKIEVELGRKRLKKFGPRLIDIDILFFNDEIISTAYLTIPHPEIQNRQFALVPLLEIAPEFKHPVLQKTVSELARICTDKLKVKVYTC